MDRLRRPRHFSAPSENNLENLPDNLWGKCSSCHELIYIKELQKSFRVCPKCGHHLPLTAPQRIELLLDPESFEERFGDLEPADPLGFVAGDASYLAKLAEEQKETGLRDAAVCGVGTIMGQAVAFGVLDFRFLGASMGSVVGEKITRLIELAATEPRPLVTVSASGGARMHEGILSLMQMAKTVDALAQLGESRQPFLSVLTDPTTGGVMASFASLGDVIIAEPGALIGFTGPRIIEQITRQKLPPGFHTAEFALEHGMIDLVVHRRDLRETLGNLLALYGGSSPGRD